MYGAILGDIIGQPYEFDRGNKTKDFPLFADRPRFTDDTVMTIAICDGILKAGLNADKKKMKDAMIKSVHTWGHNYPKAGYGQKFYLWIAAKKTESYGSYGNGSAMRVSSVGWFFDTLERTREVAQWSAEITHNHPEGIKGAEATASVIWMARNGKSKSQIKEYVIREFGYDLSRTCDEIRPDYHHVESCQETVPEAITAFLEGNSFEDVIRTAVSLGGDCDTLTDIAGGMAEAFYGIPRALKEKCYQYTTMEMHNVMKEFEKYQNLAKGKGMEESIDISSIKSNDDMKYGPYDPVVDIATDVAETLFKKKNYMELNRRIMDNTQEMCAALVSLRKSIESSIEKEYIVYQEDDVSAGEIVPNKDMKILVTKNRTYEAAGNYKGKKICCLDFANNHSIGGSPWRAGAQEESMCRTSTLYPCLAAKADEFYEKHKKDYKAGLLDDMGNDDLIYIPDVTVFKTDESVPRVQKEEDWFNTDVIVSAAPQLFNEYDKKQYQALMTKRIKRILDVASKEKVQVLVLGAFGCGAFQNPPKIVADIFATLIKDYDFETVEFAVYCREDQTNYNVFCIRFSTL
ncbi:MAG: TIGR02452 family protein [Treponema sp.]|nr:TIGR02452 family protein [Treponema sp.]